MTVFKPIFYYFFKVFRGVASIGNSLATAIPYLFPWNQNNLKKEVTEQYPDPVSSRTVDDLPPRTRGLLYNDIDRCTGCGDCQKVCPVQCIQIEAEPGADDHKMWVSTFDIDFGKCLFCGLCVDVCQPNSLEHTRQFEGAVYCLSDLVKSFGKGDVSPEQRMKWIRRREKENKEGVEA